VTPKGISRENRKLLMALYNEQFGNGAVYKRLGLMAERLQLGHEHLLEPCQE
jgi:hypothetical protein